MTDPSDSNLEAQFTLEADKGGIVEEPPFHVLVLGDFCGDGQRPALEQRRPIEIDRDNFDDVIATLGSRLELELENSQRLELGFTTLDDFHPDNIFQQEPIFERLRELRKRLSAEDTFASAAREVREQFDFVAENDDEERAEAQAPQAADVNEDDLLSAILAKPAGGGSVAKLRPSTDLDRLVADLVRPHLVSVDSDERQSYIAAVDEATGTVMRGILQDKRFKALEAAWRALYFLVRRTETSTDLKIFILDVTHHELLEDLGSSGQLSDTIAYRRFVTDTIETPGGNAWSVIGGIFDFAATVPDIAGLMRLSTLAAAANAPFVTHIRPDVLGVHSLAEQPDPAEWQLSGETNEHKLWAALRAQPDAQYLGVCMPRFLARLPYGAESEPIERFAFEEIIEPAGHDSYLWANSAVIAVQLLAASFSSHGWDMRRRLFQDVDGLPVHIYKDGTETVFKPCSEVLLSDTAFGAMMEHGIMPLISFKNSDKVKLARFQSVADTELKGFWAQ